MIFLMKSKRFLTVLRHHSSWNCCENASKTDMKERKLLILIVFFALKKYSAA